MLAPFVFADIVSKDLLRGVDSGLLLVTLGDVCTGCDAEKNAAEPSRLAGVLKKVATLRVEVGCVEEGKVSDSMS